MPSTSPARYVEDTLAAVLATEASFTVARVATVSRTAAATTAYGYVTGVTMAGVTEGGGNLSGTAVARCIVEVSGNAGGEGHPPTGKKTEAMYDAIYKVIKAVYDYDLDSWPANDDGDYITRIQSMHVGSHDGDFNGDTSQYGAGIEVFVDFFISRKPVPPPTP
jgi:hypothetical protein